MNKYFILLIVYFKLTVSSFAISTIDARTWILIDYHSNEIIHEFDPDTKINPASMTKIMTSIIAFDLLKNNKLSFKYLIGRHAIKNNKKKLINANFELNIL